jgi:hypothetical protein
MKKLLLIVGLLWSAIASAQFVPGQVLTAAELNSQFALYAPLTGATFSGPIVATAATQGFLDNSTKLATTAFTKQTVLAATAEIPIASFTGGTYNFASIGSGAQLVVFASGGTVSSILTITNPGTGYQVGDCLVMVGGNGDAIVRVTSVSSGGITAASPIYGGTGYTTGAQLTGSPLPPGSRTANLNGVLTSNATIIIPAGTFLQGGRRVGFQNNTTGAFTTTVKLSNGAGGSTGTGVILAQGTANSSSILLYTDGVTDVWPENGPSGITNLPLSSLAAQASNTVVANTTGSSAPPTASAIPTCNATAAALGYAPGVGFNCNVNINASALNGATFAGPGAIGSISPSTGVFTSLTSSSGALNGTLGGLTRNQANFTSITATNTISPSTTFGIVGTTLADAANAGSVGEIMTRSTVATGIVSATPTNVNAITLSAGDWDVSGVCQFAPAATTIPSQLYCGISQISGSIVVTGQYVGASFTGGTGVNQTQASPTVQINVSGPTQVFLVMEAIFSVSTANSISFMRARRIR